jgi:hypothetical protein
MLMVGAGTSALLVPLTTSMMYDFINIYIIDIMKCIW